MDKKYYVTTPLYYVNAPPHIGHAYTTIAADVLCRFQRMRGKDVWLLTGTDEHGANIEKVALEAGKTPQQWADETMAQFRDLWTHLDIHYDDFIRTTEPRHEIRVQEVFAKLLAQGDIYKGSYEGWYCLPCENFWEESELEAGNLCPVHKRALEKVSEPSYFFKLSRFQEPLLAHFKEHPEFLMPKWRAKEISNWAASGLKDISVSRAKVKWGIPVPGDPDHTIYVWFDALLNYLTATGWDGREEGDWQRLWPADVQVMGKEIFRFHAVIWAAMLLALELPLPRTIFAHGWWTVDGEKMSKSRGNFVDSRQVTAEFGVDAFRYFLLREVPFGNDGDFSLIGLKHRYNHDLANDLGNLLSRIVEMVDKFLHGEMPSRPPLTQPFLSTEVAKRTPEIAAAMDELAFADALNIIWEVIGRLNKHVNDEKPWVRIKTDPEAVKLMLFDMVWCLRIVAGWLGPFMPSTAATMQSRLGIRVPDMRSVAGSGHSPKIEKGPPLFPRK